MIDVRSDSGHSRPVGLDPEPIKTPTGTAGRYVQHRDQPTQAQLDAVNINQVLLGQLEQLAMAAVEAIDLMFATPRRSAAVMESALGAKIGALVGEIESASVLAEQLRVGSGPGGLDAFALS
ncbi:hypothetical protein CDD83_1037 [Cordyceps sp. RAO-2017]|nr:hypothetical protein CDD83_1037 [Cordyceps sp. RAO-2017]